MIHALLEDKGAWKYPWWKMAVGDSFYVPWEDERTTARMRRAAWGFLNDNKLNWKFTFHVGDFQLEIHRIQ